jgi:uncharacterized protein YdeI (YjbR/CyaY-like superfamily)
MRFQGISCAIATLSAEFTFIPHVSAMNKSPLFFKTPIHFRSWLIEHHTTAAELMVGFHKIGSGLPSMTWSESVDEALCFGWIDGVRRRIDDTSYVQRFTPRRRGSIWSIVNVAKVEALTLSGRMQASGLIAYAARSVSRTGIYAFEQAKPAVFTSTEIHDFQSCVAAWQYFDAAAPSYKRSMTHWVVSAKRPLTRARRLSQLMKACEEHKRIPRY